MDAELLRLYKDVRRYDTARNALESARGFLAHGKKKYDDEWPWQRGAGNVTRQTKERPGDNYAWIENTKSAGLRFVGYADEICQSIRHKGWYTDEFQDEVLRGAVWQLPARHGIARYIAGYEDPCNKGAAYVDLDIVSEKVDRLTPKREDANEEAKRQAARNADSLAERIAEREREYNEAWQAGSRWSDLGDEIAKEREFTLALLVESRPERHAKRETATPHICEAIRATVRNAVAHIAEMREKRAELFEQYGDADGFAEFLPRA
jgi:hypothetical protein